VHPGRAPELSREVRRAASLARFAASLRSSTCSSLCAVACACVELCAVTTHLTRPSFHLRLLAVSSDCVNRDSLPHCSVQSDPLTELTFCVGTLFPSPASCRFLVPASTTRVSRHSSRQPCVSFCRVSIRLYPRIEVLGSTGCVFSEPASSFYELAQLAPYELTHVRPSPGDCAAG
jgi:hypothetical protein